MNSLIVEAVQKLIHSNPQYVEDALWDCEARFDQMSDNRVDSLYAEPARAWRRLAFNLKSSRDDPSENHRDEFDEDDYAMIAAAILWYDLHYSQSTE